MAPWDDWQLWKIVVLKLVLLVTGCLPMWTASDPSPSSADIFLTAEAGRQVQNKQYAAAMRTLDRIVEWSGTHKRGIPIHYWEHRAEAEMGLGLHGDALRSALQMLRFSEWGLRDPWALVDRAKVEACSPERMPETLENVETCLFLGADPNGADSNGRTALDWASLRGDQAITRTLVGWGADPAFAALAARETARTLEEAHSGGIFRDCPRCPRMVVVPAGSYPTPATLLERQEDILGDTATIESPFAVGVYEVTFAEWAACLWAGNCVRYNPPDHGWGRGRRPVINVTWEHAQTYSQWLSSETGEQYRLLNSDEWEYVARAGTTTSRYWGESEAEQCRYENGADAAALEKYSLTRILVAPCSDGYPETAPVGSFQPNAFGLYDVLGNVAELTQWCCSSSGGSWRDSPRNIRALATSGFMGADNVGFRVSRTVSLVRQP